MQQFISVTDEGLRLRRDILHTRKTLERVPQCHFFFL